MLTIGPQAAPSTSSLFVRPATLEDRPLRILHVVATNRGARWMVEQLFGLRSRGHYVSALVSGPGSTTQELSKVGISYNTAAFDPGWSIHYWYKVFLNIHSLAFRLYHWRYDVVHYSLFSSSIVGRLAAWIADVPIRITMVAGPVYIESPGGRLIEAGTGWMDTRIIGCCKNIIDLYEQAGISSKKLDLIHYGPDASRFDPSAADGGRFRQNLWAEFGIDPGCVLVGMVAYFYPPLAESDFHPRRVWNRPIKDHQSLIEAWRLIIEKFPGAKLLLVGDGWLDNGRQHMKEVKRRVEALGLGDSIVFTGDRQDIPDVLAALDVSVQCSLSEGHGGTIESLLMSRPLVATRVGGMVDSVIDGETGLLVPLSDPEELAQAITRLLEDPALGKRLGANGRRRMLERFCLDTTINRLDRLYQECAGHFSGATDAPASHGYRLPVVLLRAVLSAPIAVFLAWVICRRDAYSRARTLLARLQWAVKEVPKDTSNRLYWAASAFLTRLYCDVLMRLYWIVRVFLVRLSYEVQGYVLTSYRSIYLLSKHLRDRFFCRS